MKNLIQYSLFAAVLFSSIACEKDEPKNPTNEPSKGAFEIEFDNRAGNANLQLNTEDYIYTNVNGDDLRVTELKYYISGIELVRADGSVYQDPMSNDGSKGFYLIDEAKGEDNVVVLNDIPESAFTDLRFTIGVDGNQVEEGAQTGALDVTNNMFWNWNAGWIFVRFQGESPSSTEENNEVAFHIGGYQESGENPMLANNLKTVTIPLGYEVKVAEGRLPTAHINVDVMKLFSSPNVIDFSENALRHSPVSCVDLADNFPNAFVLDHIHE